VLVSSIHFDTYTFICICAWENSFYYDYYVGNRRRFLCCVVARTCGCSVLEDVMPIWFLCRSVHIRV